jgi:hypothetical protein
MTMEIHSLYRLSFGTVGTITSLMDGWIDEDKFPRYMRTVPKA